MSGWHRGGECESRRAESVRERLGQGPARLTAPLTLLPAHAAPTAQCAGPLVPPPPMRAPRAWPSGCLADQLLTFGGAPRNRPVPGDSGPPGVLGRGRDGRESVGWELPGLHVEALHEALAGRGLRYCQGRPARPGQSSGRQKGRAAPTDLNHERPTSCRKRVQGPPAGRRSPTDLDMGVSERAQGEERAHAEASAQDSDSALGLAPHPRP